MAIELKNIVKSYGKKEVLCKVSLSVPPGQVLGYLGPNGAGKTTTVKIITGMLKPDRGSVSVCGFDALKDPVSVKSRVGYVPEAAVLYESMTPMEYGAFVGRLHLIDDHILMERLRASLNIFGLYDNRHDTMATFSKGMKQKILILSALLHNPPLVILDEPLNGLDANAALLLKEVISKLAAKGRTVFYCSHLMDVVEKVCHQVVILKEGKIVAKGTVDQVQELSGSGSMEAAFSSMTSTTDWVEKAEELLEALNHGEAG